MKATPEIKFKFWNGLVMGALFVALAVGFFSGAQAVIIGKYTMFNKILMIAALIFGVFLLFRSLAIYLYLKGGKKNGKKTRAIRQFPDLGIHRESYGSKPGTVGKVAHNQRAS